MEQNTGKLFMIPNVIADNTQSLVIPEHIRRALPAIEHFLVEDVRTARRYLSSLKIYPSIEPLTFEVLNKESTQEPLDKMIAWLRSGFNVGVISESGCPGVADPGALAVQHAHQHNVQVVPLVGPSSLLLALMASGLNGQHFAFHGYLPIDAKDLARAVRDLERESRQKNQTQLLIETPYRNNAMVKVLLQTLNDNTLLTLAADITGDTESIITRRVSEWRLRPPQLPKTPVVFLFLGF